LGFQNQQSQKYWLSGYANEHTNVSGWWYYV